MMDFKYINKHHRILKAKIDILCKILHKSKKELRKGQFLLITMEFREN